MTDKPLIIVTAPAVQHIKEILKRHKDSVGFRLSVKKTGCSGYMYEPKIISEEGENDIRVDTAQGVVIFIDYEWLPVLAGTIIDLEKGELGQKKLIYNNPNVDDECGCGESFNLKK